MDVEKKTTLIAKYNRGLLADFFFDDQQHFDSTSNNPFKLLGKVPLIGVDMELRVWRLQ